MAEARPIPGWPGYLATEDGFILSVRGRTRKTLRATQRRRSARYLCVTLYDGSGGRQTLFVHSLIAASFLGGRPSGMQVRHKNGDARDNRVENLAWGTQSENEADKIAHGTVSRGTRQHLARLSDDAVSRIRTDLRSGRRVVDVAREHGVSWWTIRDIRKGRTWKHVA